MKKKIFVNDEETMTACIHVCDLVAELHLPEKGVALAVNNRVVPRASWCEVQLNEGDKVTIIKAAFGG